MKNMMLVALCVVVIAAVAVAQNPTYANPVGGVTGGIQGIDKLGAHQNGGRGCVGCHAPHSGARGNGGNVATGGTVTDPDTGELALWGQDIGPLYGQTFTFAGNMPVTLTGGMHTMPERLLTGVAMCLSCHDGNIAKGAMMTNIAFEQTAGLLPPGYGAGNIPTLLGNDGSTAGNYLNDHPVGEEANLGTLAVRNYVQFDATPPTKLTLIASPSNQFFNTFITNYGAPTITGARTGAGFAVESTMTDKNQAYVVCTTCHTPHSMYTANASATNKIATLSSGTFPSYFFIAAPYNPGANTANGTKASSATQFCRQCHFSGAGGSNEASGISIPTAF